MVLRLKCHQALLQHTHTQHNPGTATQGETAHSYCSKGNTRSIRPLALLYRNPIHARYRLVVWGWGRPAPCHLGATGASNACPFDDGQRCENIEMSTFLGHHRYNAWVRILPEAIPPEDGSAIRATFGYKPGLTAHRTQQRWLGGAVRDERAW